MDIDLLVANAYNDQWREVIILAAGLASRAQCTQLVSGLIQRGDEDHAHRHQLHLLTVSCLETAIELEPQVKAEVEQRLSKLVPPQNMTDAKTLAAAGELAVKYLMKKRSYTGVITAACIRALATIGGDAALDVLEGYARDDRETVVKELIKASHAFDREDYARRVLNPKLLKVSTLHLARISSLEELIKYVTNLTVLYLSSCPQVSDLTPISSLTNLTELHLSNCPQVSDLTPLGGLVGLKMLDMIDCPQVSDLAPLVSLINLTELRLSSCSHLSDLTPLASLTNLIELYLSSCSQIRDFNSLTNLTKLNLVLLGDDVDRSLIPQSIMEKLAFIRGGQKD
jgi:hypothetical protein